jgi:hypothetical protein
MPSRLVGENRIPISEAAVLQAFVMKSGTRESNTRHCLQCGKPIVHRRITALYCSGKCREIHNANKRRLTPGEEEKTPSPPAHAPEADDSI